MVVIDGDIQLLADRAVFRAGSLYVADVHLGKAMTFGTLGVPIGPAAMVGTTRADLDRLAALVRQTGAERLFILGDLLHSPQARDPVTLGALEAFRAELPELPITLVRGNHDARAGDPPCGLGFACVDEPFAHAGLVLRHHPPRDQTPAEGLTLCGHTHPAVHLFGGGGGGGGGRGRERARCFHLSGKVLTLPAFGSFTGCAVVKPGFGDRVFAIGPGEVIELTPQMLVR